jgi:hypothetical protein
MDKMFVIDRNTSEDYHQLTIVTQVRDEVLSFSRSMY